MIGTALLIPFGNGGVANVVLAKTKGHGAGWIMITTGWTFGWVLGVNIELTEAVTATMKAERYREQLRPT